MRSDGGKSGHFIGFADKRRPYKGLLVVCVLNFEELGDSWGVRRGPLQGEYRRSGRSEVWWRWRGNVKHVKCAKNVVHKDVITHFGILKDNG